ncbi:hypothetical protein [Arsenophonus nasoniae]|uniref:Uncharacterized protein n=1 Tax=Arsenophonus nasoniae TaxID=638 RepID=A0ABY8NWW7_9GAMM|nr:hypothetical protein [Arsenophonus nasoniae]WGM08835.1 hypothetical protein QE258_26360 [Arsenophonus nasoniae]
MQKIVASTKSHALKRAEAFALVAFLSFLVTLFYAIGAGVGKLSLNAILNLATQNPDLESLALYWGATEALFCLSVFSVLLAIVEQFSQKTTKPRWGAAWLKPNISFERMLNCLYWSLLIFLIVGFTAHNLELDVSQIQIFNLSPNFKINGFLLLLLSLGQGVLVLSGVFAVLGVMTNLSAVKKPISKA